MGIEDIAVFNITVYNESGHSNTHLLFHKQCTTHPTTKYTDNMEMILPHKGKLNTLYAQVSIFFNQKPAFIGMKTSIKIPED